MSLNPLWVLKSKSLRFPFTSGWWHFLGHLWPRHCFSSPIIFCSFPQHSLLFCMLPLLSSYPVILLVPSKQICSRILSSSICFCLVDAWLYRDSHFRVHFLICRYQILCRYVHGTITFGSSKNFWFHLPWILLCIRGYLSNMWDHL